MDTHKPSLSLGLPVFNGEKYLRQAIDSILNQTYTDFELIISDNASTDRTEEICKKYVDMDDRILYYRSEKNHGAAWNWNRVFKLSSGVYFKWVAHDDVIVPEYLSKCIRVLENYSSIILCHSKNAIINDSDEIVGKYDIGTINDSLKPHDRFGQMMQKTGLPWLIFGVFRKDELGKTSLFKNYIGSDWTLLAEVSLLGRISEIQEYLFLRRDHKDSYTDSHYMKPVKIHDYRTETLWWTGGHKKPLLVLPNWKLFIEFFKTVNSVPLGCSERLRCYKEISRWFLKNGWHLMKWDLKNEFELWRAKLH